MEEELKHPKKRRQKKVADADGLKGLEALAKFTSSDVIRQVKAGLSRIAPLEEMDSEEPSFPSEEPPSL